MTRTSDDQEIPGCEGCERLRAERDEALRIDRENREAYSVDRAEYAHNEARVYRENAKLRAALETAGATVALLNSMVLGGEDHSDRSRAAVDATLAPPAPEATPERATRPEVTP